MPPTTRQLRRWRKQLNGLRSQAANLRDRQITALAGRIGITVQGGGRHPWKLIFPNRTHVTVPGHSGPLGKRLAQEILDRLEGYLEELEEGGSENE